MIRSARTHRAWTDRLRHVVYAGGWGASEPLWRVVARAGQVHRFSPLLEATLAGFGKYPAARSATEGREKRAQPESQAPQVGAWRWSR